MKKIFISISVIFISLLFIVPAYATYMTGHIYCDTGNRQIDPSLDKPLAGVKVSVIGADGFTNQAITDANGYYIIGLYIMYAQNYTLIIDPSTLPADAEIIIPSPPIQFSNSTGNPVVDVLIKSATCLPQSGGACWMTAGGVKFDPVLMVPAAEKGPKFNFGGNTNPGCGPGGQWNFVDRLLNIHFQGWEIDWVFCGNVPGIPDGSTSPKTPFNYINFSGTGTIKAAVVNGNAKGKTAAADTPQNVFFFAHFEDRNEPGNLNAGPNNNDGAKVDQLFLRVYTNASDPLGSIIYCIAANNDCSTSNDPETDGLTNSVPITGGNIQIHISSCP